ncbi:ABC transporter ATP-binding protein [Massilia pinisoli]|uniref:ABC transporter ATP-binding protein n=1 Tax=Massilia pinisoli TaxID=1772194 RepID=A0ABT1ZQC0_9BURK|nr:ABC transporter ATP-binding protein [Massilia pinisoli]MCS0582075.1 ABC transporter ATP-binding protein [Massilia pinisoli]
MTDSHSAFALKLEHVSKIYRTYSTPQHRLFELLSGGRKQYARETRALDDVTFSLEQGGRLGIVGENGSGKSTLLKVLAGVLVPNAGTVQVNGRVSALLELGAGFNPELPGRENIRQFSMLHGMQREEIDEALPEIIQFSELRDAIDHPVKTYSSGMAVRLGFACAVYVKPDILIVDEALSVGDSYFQNKCMHKIKALLDGGTSFIYVTHAADSIRSLCNRGVWMEKGRTRLIGSSTDVGAAYQSEVFKRIVRAGRAETLQAATDAAPDPVPAQGAPVMGIDHARHQAFEERVAPVRTGSGEARIVDISLVGEDGVETDSLPLDAKCLVRVFYRTTADLPPECALTLGVTDSTGRQLLHFNSALSQTYLPESGGHMLRVVEFRFDNPLSPGEYGFIAGIGTFTPNVRNHGQYVTSLIIDYVAGGARFSVRFPDHPANLDLWGIVHPRFTASEYALD